ncbi:DMT family transporter [Simiduia aestuariiviva]|uniref:Drug/metabolite transporter (DMT)-like permease n=1 Tax=Simiduia aestuariiviva TaxID=1510459 RepID=A0A839UU45_9GAMM|nr:DMT family transporter [Simiduia aestuariiviva]MBB3169949.1 drug/metabolite transporter (DMT)-like permease [Simiduia aestuariiviva]
MSNLPRALVLSLLTSLVASLVAAGSKLAAQYVSVHVVVASQYLVGLCLYLPLLWRERGRAFATQRPGLHLIRGLAGVLAFYAYYASLGHISLVDATLLRNSAPLFVPLIALWALQIRVPAKRWGPLAFGFIGVIVILRPWPASIDVWHLAALFAAAMMATSMIATRLLTKTESNESVLLYYFSIALAVSLPFALWHLAPAPLWVWGLLLLLGLGLALALRLYTLAYRAVKPSVLSPASYLSVVFAGVWGWLFWQELPTLWSLLGIGLVVISACWILWLGDDVEPASPRPPA